uniref:Uncharacterized protein n=1 Tax=Candidatus Kentrum sp. DK TaxID=2126562 RepID=A0A450RY18_9GAMM|nr:MAG: hypothetical protein BECKDK2373C_GA0170839_100728 [Candidatus Kentron sp. DK]VFJ53464.1 MAG: hypothetical protein BECKDK2373B_GA0170837_104227 [Candidatus Kentron sp. DK]
MTEIGTLIASLASRMVDYSVCNLFEPILSVGYEPGGVLLKR